MAEQRKPGTGQPQTGREGKDKGQGAPRRDDPSGPEDREKGKTGAHGDEPEVAPVDPAPSKRLPEYKDSPPPEIHA